MIRKLMYDSLISLAANEAKQLEKASHNPRAVQLGRLKDILESAKGSVFGNDHGFDSIVSYEDFKAAVPIGDYESVRHYVDRMVEGESKVLTRQDPFMFATTSGTTGKQKFIPINDNYIREFRRASRASCVNMYRYFPGVSAGKSLTFASPAEAGLTPGGIPYGAISGALYLMEPDAVKRFVFGIPYELYSIEDYETKYYCVLRAALSQTITSIYTLNPSTIVLLADRLKKNGRQLAKDLFDGTVTAPGLVPKAASRALANAIGRDKVRARELDKLIDAEKCVPQNVWPELQVVSCWTRAAAAFYLTDFPDLFGSVPVCDITYGASEGRGTVFVAPGKEMLAIRSHFFEFIPEDQIEHANPTVLLADELTFGSNYHILFTTSSGLFRYHINDVVKVTGWHNRTPLIEFQYKGGNVHSFTGEKITELQVVEAMTRALKEHSFKAKYFTVIPAFWPQPHYQVWIEPSIMEGAEDSEVLFRLNTSFDRELAEANIEYQSKRESLRLAASEIQIIEPGSCMDYRKALVTAGIPDSQVKLSHLNPKADVKEFFAQRLKREPACMK